MVLQFEQLSADGCKSYLVSTSDSDEAWLIDPILDEVPQYITLLERQKLKLTQVVDTHTHADHLSGSAKLRDLTGCAYVMHQLGQPKEVTDRISTGTILKLNGISIRVLHTPGHTRDSLCLIFPDRIITGDTLFLDDGGAGRDDLPGGDPAEHWESLRRLQELPEQLVVYPGHDYRDRRAATLAEQKVRNPFFKPRSQSEYIKFVEELKLGPAEWMKAVLKANCACTRDSNAVYIPKGLSACEVQGAIACSSIKEVPYVSAQELKDLIERNSTPMLLDVRENQELTGALGHLPGIKHIPLGTIAERVPELSDSLHKEIVMICKMGGRATTAAKILLEAGFTRVSVLHGGMNEWNDLGLPVKRQL